MKSYLKHFTLVILFAFSGLALGAKLDEKSIHEVLAAIDKAVVDKNVDGIAKWLSPDVYIAVTGSSQGQRQKVEMSKNEYIAMVKQGMAEAENYTYKRHNVQIKIINSKKAVVTETVTEIVTIGGQTMSNRTDEEATIELINGQLLFTRIIGNSRM